MTQRALNILPAGGPDAYDRALAALTENTRSYWQDMPIRDRPMA